MAFSLRTSVFISVTLCVLQQGFGYPLSEHAEVSKNSPAIKRIRTKRCSCSSWSDNECIYFCHLDIIWVNTPSKIAPFGLGSPLSRRRRSTGRCECADPADGSCSSFCHTSSEDPAVEILTHLGDKSNHIGQILSSLRKVVKNNLMAASRSASPKKKSRTRNHLIS